MATRYSARTGQPLTYQAGPFSEPHLYVQWGGKLPGNEQWSCGFRMYNTTATSPVADAPTVLARLAPILSAFHSASLSSARALLQFVKVNAVGVNGAYLSQVTNEQVIADVPGSGNPAATPANQVAIAVSLTTGFSRGPAHRGRFYMPLPAVTVDTDGRITPTFTGIYDAAAEGLIADVNGDASIWKMAVFSRKAGAPGRRAVTGAEVGRVLDTQRRRRRSLVEAY